MPAAPSQFAYNNPQEFWYYNAVPLQDPHGAWNISTLGGSRFGLPVLRGQNIPGPYRAGQSWKSKYPDARTITLTMWTDGQGLGGSGGSYPATDQRLAFNSNWQTLRQMFWQRNAGGSVLGQLQRNWYVYQSGSPTLVTSTALAEIAGSMDLTMNGRTNGAFSVDLLLSDPYFYGAQQSQSVSGSGTCRALGEGVVGEGFPSSVSSFTVRMTAPGTVTNTTAGTSITIGAGPSFPVTVDVLNNTVTDNGGANQIGFFSHSGSRLWFCLMPGSNTITTTAGTATVVWNDCYA